MPRAAEPSVIAPELLIRIGRLLYGERWQHQLADAIGYSQTLISLMASGQRTITRELVESVMYICAQQGAAITNYADQLLKALGPETRRK